MCKKCRQSQLAAHRMRKQLNRMKNETKTQTKKPPQKTFLFSYSSAYFSQISAYRTAMNYIQIWFDEKSI